MTSSLKLVQKFVAAPSAEGLRAWQKRMGFTYDSASEALGMVRSAYGYMLAGEVPGRVVERTTRVDRRTALACLAIEADISPFTPLPGGKVPVKTKMRNPKKPISTVTTGD